MIQKTLLLPGIDESLKRQLPATSYDVYKEAVHLMETGKWGDSLKKVSSIEQDDKAKDFLIGTCYASQGKFKLAEEAFTLALSKGENLAAVYLGMLHVQ